MLKKLLKSLLIVVIFSYANVFAASSCSYQEQAELNSEAANIKASYEVVKELVDPSSYTCYNPNGCEEYREYFKITILNLTENFYIEVQNSLNDGTLTLEYNYDENGDVYFYWSKINDITTLTFKVYSSLLSKCYGDNYRTFRLTLPRKNNYSEHKLCANKSNLDICQEYVTFGPMNINQFLDAIAKENSKDNPNENETTNKSFLEKTINFIIENKIYIIGGGILVISTITFIIVKKNKRRVL